MAKQVSQNFKRTQARELDKKFVTATKALSNYLHNTGKVTDDFLGYKLHVGTFTDKLGRTWQVQAHAVLAKKKFIKRDEVIPMIRAWAIGVRVKAFIKYIIDQTFN